MTATLESNGITIKAEELYTADELVEFFKLKHKNRLYELLRGVDRVNISTNRVRWWGHVIIAFMEARSTARRAKVA